MNLYEASKQWSARPDDQRFGSLTELLSATRHYRDSAREAIVPINSLSVQPMGDDGADLALIGPTGAAARLTHWSMGQLARTVNAPADYLRRLPAPMAAANLNHGLASRVSDPANLLIHQNGGLVLRSLTSDKYSRIWDCDVVERLQDFGRYGWQVPPARPCRADQPGARIATEDDCLVHRMDGLGIKPGDTIAPAGLYASDHDMFAFMVNEERRINDGTPDGLSRGFFISNSEVGAAALKVTCFLYRHVCGNHIVWDASGVSELKIVHRGEADAKFHRELTAELVRYADSSASDTEGKIESAKRFELGKDKETVLAALFSRLRGDIPQKTVEAGYLTAETNGDNPRSAWGIVQGLTAHSQTVPHMDERNKIDRAAGKVMQMAF